VEEGALDYALKMRHPAWGPSPSYAQGDFQRSTYVFEPGVRLKLGYFRAPHFWELWWQYTRLTARGSNHVDKPSLDDLYITGTWPHGTTAPLSSASSRLHMNYNLAEFLVDRYFIPSPHLRLRLIGGAVAAWINQDWQIKYRDSQNRFTNIRNRWRFVGGGLRIGTMFDWYWTGHLYMTALGTTGILFGGYTNKSLQTTDFQPTAQDDTTTPIRDTTYRDIRPTFTAQAMMGPSWQQNFAKYRLEFFAGYEMNIWWNLQEIYRSTASSPESSKETWLNTALVSVHGVTTRISLDF
jgi:hypothetical protein